MCQERFRQGHAWGIYQNHSSGHFPRSNPEDFNNERSTRSLLSEIAVTDIRQHQAEIVLQFSLLLHFWTCRSNWQRFTVFILLSSWWNSVRRNMDNNTGIYELCLTQLSWLYKYLCISLLSVTSCCSEILPKFVRISLLLFGSYELTYFTC